MSAVITRSTMTDDSGGGVDGTIFNNAWLQDIYDRVDAMFSDTAIFAHGGGISTLALSTMRVDSAGTAEIVHLKNWNTTNNNSITTVFMCKDNGGTERVVGYYGMRVTDHSTGAIVGEHAWYNKTGSIILQLSQTGVLTPGSNITMPAANVIAWSGRAILASPADGQFTLTNNAASAGVLFRFSTDGRFEVRNRANSDFADIYGKAGVFTGDVTAVNFNGDLNGNAATADAYSGVGFSGTVNPINQATFAGGFCTAAS